MRDINQVSLTGNLTRDPELRSTASGMQVLSFGLAVNASRKAQDGSWEDYPNFVDCTMFGNRAEAVSRYLSKGAKVAVSGELRYSSWERDGQRRSKLEVIAGELVLMQRRDGGHQAAPAQSADPWSQTGTAAQRQAAQGAGVYDEEIPF